MIQANDRCLSFAFKRNCSLRSPIRRIALSCALVAACLLMSITATAQTFTSLFDFNYLDGAYPYYGSLIVGPGGNLYGTTWFGGAYGYGTIFQVTPAGAVTTLYNFCPQYSCANGGGNPYAGLTNGQDGNLYGVTGYGGTNGDGTVFQITPEGTFTAIYIFCTQPGCDDGLRPEAGLTLAKNGTFYGTTTNGGANGFGTIFNITTEGTLTVLYSFCAQTDCEDGYEVFNPLVEASNGNLYGTTASGGAHGRGTVFQITSSGKFTVLHSFDYTDGAGPYGGLVLASNGNLYGTTAGGGTGDGGTIFYISKGNKFQTLYNFCSKEYCADGSAPFGALIQGQNGRLYGTTLGGGTDGLGTVFEFSSAGVLTTLHTFNGIDGGELFAGVAQTSNGTIYGTTMQGGDLPCNPGYGCGTVFSIAP